MTEYEKRLSLVGSKMYIRDSYGPAPSLTAAANAQELPACLLYTPDAADDSLRVYFGILWKMYTNKLFQLYIPAQ